MESILGNEKPDAAMLCLRSEARPHFRRPAGRKAGKRRLYLSAELAMGLAKTFKAQWNKQKASLFPPVSFKKCTAPIAFEKSNGGCALFLFCRVGSVSIQSNRQDNNRAKNHFLPIGIDLQQVHAIIDESDNQRTC